jgi:hypothetical protein
LVIGDWDFFGHWGSGIGHLHEVLHAGICL